MENHVENVGIVGIVLACWSLHRNDERQSEWHLAGQSNQGNPAEKCANDLMPTNSSGENDLLICKICTGGAANDTTNET